MAEERTDEKKHKINGKLVDKNVASYNHDILKPIEVIDEFPVTCREKEKILSYRQQVQDIYDGKDPRVILILGPCSIHSYEGAINYGTRLKQFIDRERVSDELFIVMRSYFEKPRTGPDWPGFIFDPDLVYYINPSFCDKNKGRRLSRKILKELTNMGLPLGMEFLDSHNPQYIGEFISWGAIGARTCETPGLRWMASGLSMPIGFKNNTSGDISAAVGGVVTARAKGHKFDGITLDGEICEVTGKGNPYTHVVLRGGNGTPNYRPEAIEQTSKLLDKAGLEKRIMIDCSHGNCTEERDGKKVKIAENQLLGGESLRQQILAGNKYIFGVMYESNLKPGKQSFPKRFEDIGKVDPDITLTDPGLSWEKMEEEIMRWYEMMKRLKC